MRILHFIPNMAGGGAERQLTYLVRAQIELRHEVHVALCGGGPNLDRLAASGAQVHFLDTMGNHDPFLLFRAISMVRKLRPDIVQTWLLQMDIIGGLGALMNGVPFIVSERSSAMAYQPSVKFKARELIACKSAAIIANSEGGCAYWRPILPKYHPCFVVPNCIPRDEIEATIPRLPTNLEMYSDVPRILYLGRLVSSKRIELLLDAFRMIIEQTRAVLFICGNGSEETAIHRCIQNDNRLRNRVVVIPYQEHVWCLMKSCQLFVSLSSFEGSPNTVLEAAACGLPLLLSNIKAHHEAAGDLGTYVSEDIGEISECMLTLLGNSNQREFLPGVEDCSKLLRSPREVGEMVLRCYEKVLHGGVE